MPDAPSPTTIPTPAPATVTVTAPAQPPIPQWPAAQQQPAPAVVQQGPAVGFPSVGQPANQTSDSGNVIATGATWIIGILLLVFVVVVSGVAVMLAASKKERTNPKGIAAWGAGVAIILAVLACVTGGVAWAMVNGFIGDLAGGFQVR